MTEEIREKKKFNLKPVQQNAEQLIMAQTMPMVFDSNQQTKRKKRKIKIKHPELNDQNKKVLSPQNNAVDESMIKRI